MYLLSYIFPKAQLPANKNAHNFWNQIFSPIFLLHLNWRNLFQCFKASTRHRKSVEGVIWKDVQSCLLLFNLLAPSERCAALSANMGKLSKHLLIRSQRQSPFKHKPLDEGEIWFFTLWQDRNYTWILTKIWQIFKNQQCSNIQQNGNKCSAKQFVCSVWNLPNTGTVLLSHSSKLLNYCKVSMQKYGY